MKSSRNKSNCVIIYKIWMGSLKIEDKFQWLLSNGSSSVRIDLIGASLGQIRRNDRREIKHGAEKVVWIEQFKGGCQCTFHAVVLYDS